MPGFDETLAGEFSKWPPPGFATREAEPCSRLVSMALRELGIDDPGDKVATVLSRYSTQAILQGVAVFSALSDAGQLPPDAERFRYLGGIVRNLDAKLRLERIADKLLDLRLKHSDLLREPLVRAHQSLLDTVAPTSLPQAFLERSLHAQPLFEHRFWAKRAAEALSSLEQAASQSVYRHLARIVAAHRKLPIDRREHILGRLSQAVALARAAA